MQTLTLKPPIGYLSRFTSTDTFEYTVDKIIFNRDLHFYFNISSKFNFTNPSTSILLSTLNALH